MKIVLIRHGETVGNASGRYSGGDTDEPLSPAGLRMAEESRARFAPAPACVYVSPMQRAVATARALFPNAVQHPVEGLREMHFGRFDGKTADELADDPDYMDWVNTGRMLVCPGGESVESFSARVLAAFSKLVSDAVARKDERLTVVAHGGVIMAIMAQCATPAKADFYDWRMKNCCGYTATLAGIEAGVPRLVDYRDAP